MRINRREFIEKALIVGGLSVLQPWELIKMTGSRSLVEAQRIIDQLDVSVEAMPLTKNYEISSGSMLCDSRLSQVTRNGSGNAVFTITDSTSPEHLRPAGIDNAIVLDVTGAPTGANAIQQLIWTINTTLLPISSFLQMIWTNNTSITTSLRIAQAASMTPGYNYSHTATPNAARVGWNAATFDRATPTSTTGSPNIANAFIRMRLEWIIPVGQTGRVVITPIYINKRSRAKVSFGFDDSYLSQYTQGFTYLNARKIRGSHMIMTNLVDGGLGVTVANLNEMQDNKWSLHNHSVAHTNLTTVPIQQAKDEMREARDWMAARRLTKRGAKTVVYPGGATNDAVDMAMQELGYRYGAIVRAQVAKHWDGLDQPMRIDRFGVATSTSIANIVTQVDNTVKIGGNLILYFHDISAVATGGNVSIATFQGVVDYVYKLEQSNVLDIVTLQEFIDGLVFGRKIR